MIKLAVIALVALSLGAIIHTSDGQQPRPHAILARPQLSPSVLFRSRRSDHHHKTMLHNHLSRKVFDRACAASKDTIDEIIACLTTNQALLKAVKEDTAKACYKDSFGLDFDPKDVIKHKELICNNREKFETMTTCVYKKTADVLDAKEMERMAEAMVDVGLCIINALDG